MCKYIYETYKQADESLAEIVLEEQRKRVEDRARNVRAPSLKLAEAWERGRGYQKAEIRENSLTGHARSSSYGTRQVEVS